MWHKKDNRCKDEQIIKGSKKQEKEGKQNLKGRVVIGSLVYGIIVGAPFVYRDGTFHLEDKTLDELF